MVYMRQYIYHHCSDNSLSPGRHQAIIWTNSGIGLIWSLGYWHVNRNAAILVEEHEHENVVCEMAHILPRPQTNTLMVFFLNAHFVVYLL